MFRYRMARCCLVWCRSTTWPRRSTKSRASKIACCAVISRARRTNKRAAAPAAALKSVPSQQKNRRPPGKVRPLAFPPHGDWAAHDFLARQAEIDRHAEVQFRAASRKHCGKECLVAVRRLDEQLRRTTAAQRLVERAQGAFAQAGLGRQVTVESE